MDPAEPGSSYGGEMTDDVRTGRLDALLADLAGMGSVLVAFSGGVDSAFVVAAAARALPANRVLAATAVSASLATGERDRARDFCRDLGVAWEAVGTHEIDREGYRANAGDRCFHCKSELLDRLRPLAAERGLAFVATGTNADDVVAGFRPGIRAAAQRGARTPLLDAGLTKADIRGLSRAWDLPTWDKPAAACLSSRIAFGVEISPRGLARVDRAEQAVRQVLAAHRLPAQNLRVRDLGQDLARVELDAGLLPRLVPAAREELTRALTGAGFATVEVDPRGFRSGSMNELLPDPELFR